MTKPSPVTLPGEERPDNPTLARRLEALACDCDSTDGWEEAAPDLRLAASRLSHPVGQGVGEPFQARVDKWMDACFGDAIKADRVERCDRFIEEALELVQTEPTFTRDRAHSLVDYVFGRDVGEATQEVGGVMVTLAALCNAFEIDVDAAAETELARVWTKVDAIRAKQAAKPTGSALPIAQPIPVASPGNEAGLAEGRREVEQQDATEAADLLAYLKFAWEDYTIHADVYTRFSGPQRNTILALFDYVASSASNGCATAISIIGDYRPPPKRRAAMRSDALSTRSPPPTAAKPMGASMGEIERIPQGRASFWQRLRCSWFHRRHRVWWPIHHSWGFQCKKCGLEGIEYDL